MHYAVFSGGKYYLYIMHFSIFSRVEDFLYYVHRSVFGGSILCTPYIINYVIFSGSNAFIQCATFYFRGVNTIVTMHNVVFTGGKYYLYDAQRSIFWG